MNCKKELLESVKRMKWVLMLICLFSLPLCLTSCGEDDEEEITSDAAALVGTWEHSEEDFHSQLTLNSDGTFIMSGYDEGDYFRESGTWSATNNQIFFKYQGEEEEDSWYYRIANNTLYTYESHTDYSNNKYASSAHRK